MESVAQPLERRCRSALSPSRVFISLFSFVMICDLLSYLTSLSRPMPVHLFYFDRMNFGLRFLLPKLWMYIPPLLLLLRQSTRKLGFAVIFFWSTYWVTRVWSIQGAFSQMVPVLSAFALFFYGSESISGAARFTLGAMFLNGAIGKINSAFLGGIEFRDGAFARVTEFFYPFLHPLIFAVSGSTVFLWSIIVFEFLIGLFFLVNFRLGVLLFLLFVFTGSFIQPPVMFVFFVLAPLVYISDPGIFSSALERHPVKMAAVYLALYLLSGAAFQLLPGVLDPARLFFVGASVSVGILAFGLLALNWKTKVDSLSRPLVLFDTRTIAWCTIFLIYLALPYKDVLPPPLGFSMFSGRKASAPAVLAVADAGKCQWFRRHFAWGIWGLARVSDLPGGQCVLHLPSRSALLHFKRMLGDGAW